MNTELHPDDPAFAPRLHADGSATYWSVYFQEWTFVEWLDEIPRKELDAQPSKVRAALEAHLPELAAGTEDYDWI